MTEALWALDATTTARMVAAGEVSASEVLEAHLRRIDSVNPRLNAIVRRADDHASLIATLRAARALRRSDHFTGLEPRKNLSHVEFLSDGTRRTVSLPRTPSS